MRVAALYDVHGYLPALEAVLEELKTDEVDAIVSGGDLVWGPFPAECLELLTTAGARFLLGNADRETVSGREPRDVWCRERLSATQIEEVAGWPPTVELEVEELGRVLFCHGSPRSDEEMLTEATPDGDVASILGGSDADVVVCGHTHHQFDRPAGSTRLVNPGSVGLPYEGERGAFWAVLGPGVELRRTGYDVDAELLTLSSTGFPAADELYGSLSDPVPKAEAVRYFESQRGA